MLQLSSITKSFGDRVLLEDVTWQITTGERVGLCGPNGAGKTTLLKLLAGFDEPDQGSIIKPSALTVGYLPQDGLAHTGRSILDEASSAFGDLLDVKHEMHAIEERLGDTSVPQDEHDAMLERYSALQDRFRIEEGYGIDLKVATVLRGLGFADEVFGQPTDALSGGWQMRLALAKLLLGRPTLLLLDEPTNHLDLEARNWLEEYLAAYPHSVILVHRPVPLPGNQSLAGAKPHQDARNKVVPIEAPPERKRIHFTFPVCAKSGRSVPGTARCA